MTSTANFGWNLPAPETPMSDVADSFNNTFTAMNTTFMGPSKGVVAGSVLPTKTGGALPGDYQPGDTIHLTGWKSNFILVAYNPLVGSTPYMGYVWRPIHAAWGPWVDFPDTVLSFPTTFSRSVVNPLRYRVSNRGEIQLTGGMRSFNTGTGLYVPWPKYTGGSGTQLAIIPSVISPPMTITIEATLTNLDLTLTNKPYQFANFNLQPSGFLSARAFNSSIANDGVANEIHFNNVVWDMGIRTDLMG